MEKIIQSLAVDAFEDDHIVDHLQRRVHHAHRLQGERLIGVKRLPPALFAEQLKENKKYKGNHNNKNRHIGEQ
ncbi:hypothetical protein [Paenibacillus lautus]|uniref:hypothetical protein n=1 Tax=Paenibacillus lautus TaxID=1401 RepID=UPI001FEAE6DE|nr:hypothetical protein [Paenibacillus lautus]